MIKKILALGVSLLALSANAKPFDHIVTLGDSLSDTGNLYRYTFHMVPKSPPYYKGHFSNGPMWIEHLYQKFFPGRMDQAEYNFAVGGAAAVIEMGNTLPYSLATQVDDYLYLHNYKDKEKTLYVVWAGANNYVNLPKTPEETSTKVVDAIESNIEKLIDHGATMFLIPNLPDLGATPDAKRKQGEAELSEMTALHNAKLSAKIAELKAKHPTLTFASFNVASIFEDVTHHPEKYQLTNVTDSCSDAGNFALTQGESLASPTLAYLKSESQQHGLSLSEQQMKALLANPSISEAIRIGYRNAHTLLGQQDNCAGYMFWDNLHPTTHVHEKLAEFAYDAILSQGLTPVA